MIGWLKRRRKEKMLAEMHDIAARMGDLANDAMNQWEATSLEGRRAMLADSFDERLTEIVPTDELPFQELAEIEALALLKNWIERKQEVVDEIVRFINPDAWETLKLVGAAEEYFEQLGERFDSVGHQLAEDLVVATEEETQRRQKA